MIKYIFNQLYNLQGLFVRVSDSEELVGVTSNSWHTTLKKILIH